MKKIFFSLLLIFFIVSSIFSTFIMSYVVIDLVIRDFENIHKIIDILCLDILYIIDSIGLCVISSIWLYKYNKDKLLFSLRYGYESYKTNRESKSKAKMENKLKKIQTKINKLNNESDE